MDKGIANECTNCDDHSSLMRFDCSWHILKLGSQFTSKVAQIVTHTYTDKLAMAKEMNRIWSLKLVLDDGFNRVWVAFK
jgi:hypothetical protein